MPGEGKTDLMALQTSLTGKADDLTMIAFDLLYLDGRDLRKLSLLERKEPQAAARGHVNRVQRNRAGRRRAQSARLSKIADSPYGGVRGNYWSRPPAAPRDAGSRGFKIKDIHVEPDEKVTIDALLAVLDVQE
ncbi:hypothetical protein [Bradyrhizobium tunisiense]|uniref:hypothetical protein n=1 Tax=Bradyrhizobium tunisiense TaxID=3278709 RepID=UPI0035DDC2DE